MGEAFFVLVLAKNQLAEYFRQVVINYNRLNYQI